MTKINKYENDIYNGILIINKEEGMSSHDVVNKTRKLFCTRRVGHTGTLDPMATGVLVVLVGRAAKAAEFITSGKKFYTAKLKLGITTDTEDTTGKVLTVSDNLPLFQNVTNAATLFTGQIEQIPPMYSAVKINGKKLVDLARQGITVERMPRTVNIYKIDVTPTHDTSIYTLDVECSAGTYIRTLCADIGKYLGCGGAMAALERKKNSGFDIKDSYKLPDIESMSLDERKNLLIPTEELFKDLPKTELPSFFAHLASCGAEIYQHKIKTDFKLGQRLRLYDGDRFFALGEVRDFEDGTAIKPIKFF